MKNEYIFNHPPKADRQAHTTTLEAEIPVLSVVETDQLVYAFYGLSEQEIVSVEESVKN